MSKGMSQWKKGEGIHTISSESERLGCLKPKAAIGPRLEANKVRIEAGEGNKRVISECFISCGGFKTILKGMCSH